MSSIVNPTNGSFPKKSALQVREEFERTHPAPEDHHGLQLDTIGPFSSFSGYSGIGRINCVAFHPTDQNIYWVGAAGGLMGDP